MCCRASAMAVHSMTSSLFLLHLVLSSCFIASIHGVRPLGDGEASGVITSYTPPSTLLRNNTYAGKLSTKRGGSSGGRGGSSGGRAGGGRGAGRGGRSGGWRGGGWYPFCGGCGNHSRNAVSSSHSNPLAIAVATIALGAAMMVCF